MNQKHILFPSPGDFLAPFSGPSLPLPPSSPHFLFIPSLELGRALELE